MQDAYVIEVKLGVHLLALLVHLVLLGICFLLVITTSVWTDRITYFLFRDI